MGPRLHAPLTRAFLLVLSVVALSVGARTAPPQPSELVIHVKGTALYHRAGCPTIKNADVVALTKAQAESRGHRPHDACDPTQQPGASGGESKAEPPPTVFLDGTKYYHRKDCKRLAGPTKPRAESLEVAGKSHWPCPDCRPPVRRRSAEPAVPGTGRRR
jgi:hypothetical protein